MDSIDARHARTVAIAAGQCATTALLTAVLALAPTSANASPTVWTGPPLSFSHTVLGDEQDAIIPNAVAIARNDRRGLFNAATESFAIAGFSPQDTEWAVGPLTNFDSLSYSACPLEMGNSPPSDVGTTYVVHLMAEDVYLSLHLDSWGSGLLGDSSFSYTRSTSAAAPPPPMVSLTNPPGNAVFAAPASLKLMANASAGGGTVTNVEFFAGGTSLGSVTNAPFNLTTVPLATNAYVLTAVATAGGVSATSAPVSVTVVLPVATALSGGVTNGQFLLAYTVTPGLSYVVQTSSNLSAWQAVVTNVPAGGQAFATNSFTRNGNAYFRVMRLPNP